MTAINLKGDFWIRGFDTNEEVYNFKDSICFLGEPVPYIYIGKTSEIPEDLAEKCVIQFGLCKGTQLDDGSILQEDIYFGFKNYKPGFGVVDFETPKESIQSACSDEFCIIYKIK